MTAVDTSVQYTIGPFSGGVSLVFSLTDPTPTLAQLDEAVQAFADVLIAAYPTSNLGVSRAITSVDQEAPWYPVP